MYDFKCDLVKGVLVLTGDEMSPTSELANPKKKIHF